MSTLKPVSKATSKPAIGACTLVLDKSTNAIQLFPKGDFSAPRGALKGVGPWRLDDESAKKLIAATAQRKNDILIDYEHQSLTANAAGHAAPAAGWLNPNSLHWTDQGLYAQNPDWTEKAAAMIAADEYRYLSPVFTYDDTGTPLSIISVALTNTPAIDGMAQVSLAAAMAAFLPAEEIVMDLDDLMERLRYLLNLPVTATQTEMLTELDKLKSLLSTGEPTAAASLPALLASKDTEIAALKSAMPDPAKYVPVAALLAIQQQYQATAETAQEQKVAALIAEHPNVIIPALEPWAKELGKQDFRKLEEYINTARPIAALTATQTGGKAPVNTSLDAVTDPSVIAAKATAFQTSQAALGLAVDDCTAISHIMRGSNV